MMTTNGEENLPHKTLKNILKLNRRFKIPRKLKICDIESCEEKTYGKLCKKHDLIRRNSSKKFDTKQEYAKDWQFRKKYNLTLDEFFEYWIIYMGKCAICKCVLKLPENKKGQSLDTVVIDHDHKTGKVRGLLCNACNKGIGLFKEDLNILENAKGYLYYEQK